MKAEQDQERDLGGWIIAGIMGAVALFGIYLAIGVFRYSGRIAESWIVLGCTGGFLAFWGILLLFRRRSWFDRPEQKPPEGP